MLFEPVRILFPVAIGGIAGVTASAAGSGGAVCPSTAAGGAVIYLCTAAPAAGSGVRCARRLLRLVQSLLVLRLRCLLELVVRLLPLLCSHPGLVWVLPLPGVTAPVWSPGRFWLLGAGSRPASPLRSLAPLFSGVGAGGRQSPSCFLT